MPLVAVKQVFTYNYTDYLLNITIEAGTRNYHDQSIQDGAVLHANYHGRCSGDSALDSTQRLLKQAEKRKEHFKYCMVDFHRIYTAPKSYLLELARSQNPRIRLRPPYGEHLSQAFARYFMRVGVPADIREFAE